MSWVRAPHRTPPELRRLAMNLSVAAILVFHPSGAACIYILLFPASQTVPDHFRGPAEKAFSDHFSNNPCKDIEINALHGFYGIIDIFGW